MTEVEAFKALRRYLVKLATEAVIIDPNREALTDVIRDAQEAPRPGAAYAMVKFLAERDLEEIDDEAYSEITVGEGDDAEQRVVMCKSRGVEWLFRVNVYAQAPVDWSRLFTLGLRSAEAAVWMAPLVVRDVRKIDREPALIQQDWEGRAMFDVTLGAVVSEPLLIDVVESGEVITEGAGGASVTRSLTYTKP